MPHLYPHTHACQSLTIPHTKHPNKRTHTHTQSASQVLCRLSLIFPLLPPPAAPQSLQGSTTAQCVVATALHHAHHKSFSQLTVLHDCHDDASHASRVRDLAPSVGGSAAPVFTPNPSKTHFHSLFELYAPPQKPPRASPQGRLGDGRFGITHTTTRGLAAFPNLHQSLVDCSKPRLVGSSR